MGEFWTLLFRFSFGILCHSLILCLMTDYKYSRGRTMAVWLGTFAVTTLAAVPLILLVHDINIIFVVEAFGSLAIYCAAYLWVSDGPVWRNVFIFFTYGTFFLFSLVLSSSMSQMFFEGSHWATVVGRTIFLGAYALWLLCHRNSIAPCLLTDHMEKGWASLAAFSVFSGLTIYITALTFMILEVDAGIRLAVSAVLFLLIGSAYWVASRTIVLLNREHEAQETEAQRRLLETQLVTERAFVTQAKTYRHDLRHHISMLNDYLERGDTEGAKAYLGQYDAELDADPLDVYCRNTVANALLRYTARHCAEGAIPFTCRAVIPQALSLTGPELATVLGNVLENAWEASRRSEKPWVAVTARTRRNAVLIEVRNAVSGETRFENDLPVSTKDGGGLGLKSVSRVLEKCGGLLHCFRRGDTFFTQVVIPL